MRYWFATFNCEFRGVNRAPKLWSQCLMVHPVIELKRLNDAYSEKETHNLIFAMEITHDEFQQCKEAF